MTCCAADLTAIIRGFGSVLIIVLVASPTNAFAMDHTLAEDQVCVLINEARAAQDLPPLQPREDLAAIARQRSHDMAADGSFSHRMRDGRFFDDLLDSAGIQYELGAEILARNNRTDVHSVQIAFNGWLNSPAHRDIVFDPRYNQIGVGAWTSAGGMHYFTALLLEHD